MPPLDPNRPLSPTALWMGKELGSSDVTFIQKTLNEREGKDPYSPGAVSRALERGFRPLTPPPPSEDTSALGSKTRRSAKATPSFRPKAPFRRSSRQTDTTSVQQPSDQFAYSSGQATTSSMRTPYSHPSVGPDTGLFLPMPTPVQPSRLEALSGLPAAETSKFPQFFTSPPPTLRGTVSTSSSTSRAATHPNAATEAPERTTASSFSTEVNRIFQQPPSGFFLSTPALSHQDSPGSPFLLAQTGAYSPPGLPVASDRLALPKKMTAEERANWKQWVNDDESPPQVE